MTFGCFLGPDPTALEAPPRTLDVDMGEATPSGSARDTNVCQGRPTSKFARRKLQHGYATKSASKKPCNTGNHGTSVRTLTPTLTSVHLSSRTATMDVDVGEAAPSGSARDNNVCQGCSTSKSARRNLQHGYATKPASKKPCNTSARIGNFFTFYQTFGATPPPE